MTDSINLYPDPCEIRLDQDLLLDDIVIENVHLERMGKRSWWLAVYFGKKRICFSIESKSRIKVFIIEDELHVPISL
jgi:hypothetical protein